MAKSYTMELSCLKGKEVKLAPGNFEHKPGEAYFDTVFTDGSSLEALYKNCQIRILNKEGDGIDSAGFRHLNKRHQAILMVAIQDRLEAEKQKKSIPASGADLVVGDAVGYHYRLGSDMEAGGLATWVVPEPASAALTLQGTEAAQRRILSDVAEVMYRPNPFLAQLAEPSDFSGAEISTTMPTPRPRTEPDFEPDATYVRQNMDLRRFASGDTYYRYIGQAFMIGEWVCRHDSSWSTESDGDFARMIRLVEERDIARNRPVASTVQPTRDYILGNMMEERSVWGTTLVWRGGTMAVGMTTLEPGAVYTSGQVDRILIDLETPIDTSGLDEEIPF